MDRQAKIRALKIAQLKEAQAQELGGPAPEFKDEMPEWLSAKDRAVVKNLGKDNRESISYLQKQYPDTEWMEKDGELYGRKRGETNYGRLDPSFSPISNPIGTLKDLAYDAMDIGYDVAQGAAEGVGGLLSGLAAGGATAGTGSIPGLMAGAAGGAAVASTAREKLRQMMGIGDGDISAGDVATDAVLAGSMAGLLPGAGRAIRKYAPKLASRATGLSEEILKRIGTRGDDLARMDADGALNMVKQVSDDVATGVNQQIRDITQRYADAGQGAGRVDLRDANRAVNDYINDIRDQITRNPGRRGALEKELDEAIKFREEFMGKGFYQADSSLDDALRTNTRLNELIDFDRDALGQGATPTKERLAKLFKERQKEAINKATSGAREAIDGDYGSVLDMQDFAYKYFGNSRKTENALRNLGTGKNMELDGMFQRLPQQTQEAIMNLKNDLDARKFLQGSGGGSGVIKKEELGKAALDTLGGSTPLSKLMTGLGTGIGYTTALGLPFGGQVGAVLGGGIGRTLGNFMTSPASVKKLSKFGIKAGDSIEKVERLFWTNPEVRQIILGTLGASKG